MSEFECIEHGVFLPRQLTADARCPICLKRVLMDGMSAAELKRREDPEFEEEEDEYNEQ